MSELQDLLKALAAFFKPIHDLWWLIFGTVLTGLLTGLYHFFSEVPVLSWIGAYGLSIIVLTLGVKLLLAPLTHFQLTASRKAMADQRRVAPQLSELRKKHKSDPAKLQEETMKLYKEHGVNPFGGLAGCLPTLLQMPILIALYWVFLGPGSHFGSAHFLFIPDLNVKPADHHLLAGLPLIPSLPYLVIPILAGITSFIQAKMIQQPPNPAATEQEQQAQQTAQMMSTMMPLMIAYFAIITPAGLGLYWFVNNCIAIVQQYFVNGWGGLRRNPPAGPAVAPAGAGPSRPGPARVTKANPTSKRGRKAKR